MRYETMNSPVGELLLFGEDERLHGLHLEGAHPASSWTRDRALFVPAVQQLRAYFARELKEFDLALAPEGTAFQQRVWSALRDIPYGATATYADIARAIKKPGAARAVGQANSRNPIAIMIPCHRVIAYGGKIG